MAIRGYSHRVTSPNYEVLYRDQKEGKIEPNAVIYGMELELAARTEDGWRYLHHQGEGANPVACRDGSLGDMSAELKFRPAVFHEQLRSLMMWNRRVARFLRGPVEEHLYIPARSAYGLHVHASKSVLSQAIIHRLAALHNGPNYVYDLFLRPWTERTVNSYCAPNLSLQNLLQQTLNQPGLHSYAPFSGDRTNPIWARYFDSARRGHHAILSDSGAAPTVEFRAYLASSNIHHVIAKLAHVVGLIEYCREHARSEAPFFTLFDPQRFLTCMETQGFKPYLSALSWPEREAEILHSYPEHLRLMLRSTETAAA